MWSSSGSDSTLDSDEEMYAAYMAQQKPGSVLLINFFEACLHET
jgi:hypothetical protein